MSTPLTTPPLYPAFGVLLVDDEPSFLRSLSIALERSGGINHIHRCQDSREVMDILARENIGLVTLDLTMPHLSGEELLARIVEEYPDIGVIVISGLNQVETAVNCIKLGAFDYFVKTDEESRLMEGIRRAIRLQELRQENQALDTRLSGRRAPPPARWPREAAAYRRVGLVSRGCPRTPPRARAAPRWRRHRAPSAQR